MKKTLSIILTIVLIFAFGAFALGSGDSKTSVEKGEKTQEAGTSDSGRTEIHVGDTLNSNDLKITFDSVEKWDSGNPYMQPDEGNIFIRLHFSIANDTKSDQYISSTYFECYADGSKCEESYYGDDNLLFDSLSSGRKIAGYVYYEVPANASEIEVEYDNSLLSDKKAYFIVEF